MLRFMQSLPPTLPSLCPLSHASCVTQLVVMLPLVLCRLSFLSCHRLPSGGASTSPPLVAPLSLVVPPFFSGAIASCPPRLFVVSPLVMPPPPACMHLCLSLYHRLSLCPSCASCPAGCCICQRPPSTGTSNSCHAIASCCTLCMLLVHSG